MDSTTNYMQTDSYEYPIDPNLTVHARTDLQIGIEVGIVFIGMLSVIVNPVTLLAMTRSKLADKTSINVLVISLLYSDFFCGLSLAIFFTLGLLGHMLDTSVVKYVRFFSSVVAVTSFLSSSLNVLCITVDRAVATVFPFKYRTELNVKKTKMTVALVWLCSTVLIGALAALKTNNIGGVSVITFPYQIIPDTFLKYVSSPGLVGGLIINVIVYIAIVACVRNSKKLKPKSLSEMRNRKVTVTASIVVGMMLFSTVPIAVVTILPIRDKDSYLWSYDMLYEISLALAIVPTFTNNFVYVSRLPECRRAFRKLFKIRDVHPATETSSPENAANQVQVVPPKNDAPIDTEF